MSATNRPKTELTTFDSSQWSVGSVASGGCCVVKVKAQVMTRDDSAGMWVPMSGGGMSVVSLHRCLLATNDDADDDVTSYVILGQRIADKSMALYCELLSDLEYTSVNPTFHHWTTNRKRFGLTFQTSSDATAFQKSIHRILVDRNMRHGPVDSKAQLHLMAEEVLTVLQQVNISTQATLVSPDDDDHESATITSPPPPSRSHHHHHHHRPTTRDTNPPHTEPIAEEEEEETRTSQESPRPQCITPHVHIRHYPPPTHPTTEVILPPKAPPRFPLAHTSPPPPPDSSGTLGDYGYVDVSPNIDRTPEICIEGGDAKELRRKVGDLLAIPTDEADELIYFSESYVHFARNTNSNPETHEYCYPSIDTFANPPYGTRPPTANQGDPRRAHISTSVPVPLPIKTRRKWLEQRKKSKKPSVTRRRAQGPKLRCVYCDEYFTRDDNRPGSCRDAPDRVLACIKTATCVCCRDAVAYHCRANEEGDSEDCDRLDCDGSRRGSARRRAVLVLICLVVPCLWCYLPFRACHRLGVTCGCCGPRHKAA